MISFEFLWIDIFSVYAGSISGRRMQICIPVPVCIDIARKNRYDIDIDIDRAVARASAYIDPRIESKLNRTQYGCRPRPGCT